MKNASIFSTTLLILSALFINQTAQAQWVNGTSIYQQDLTKKVGIGLQNPSYPLEVKGGFGLRSNANSLLGILEDDGSGNLSISAYSSAFIGSPARNLLLNLPTNLMNKIGNVGISTPNPAEARLVVKGDENHTVAMFGQGSPGISLANAWSSVGFNSYLGRTNGVLAWKSMSDGYGTLLECDPTSGRFQIVQNGYAIANESPARTTPFRIDPNGDAVIGDAAFSAGKLTVNNPDFYKSALSLEGIDPYMLFRQSGETGEIGFIHSWADNSNLNAFNGRKGLEFGTPPGDNTLMFSTNYAQRMTIESNGSVHIGSGRAANGYHLSVSGKVICEELKVQLRSAWPDYVFAPNYKLRPLEEVEAHIQAENHLPGIPTAAEMEKEGIAVGEMQVKMMEKIEELTLYLIDQNKRLEQLEQVNSSLQARLDKAESSQK